MDRDTRTVHGTGGAIERYDRLVFATGSHAFVPPISGAVGSDGELKDGVFVFRTLDDCERIADRATNAGTAVVIGGGLLGLEAAHGLLNHGLEVHVVHLMGHLMETQLDLDAGAVLERVVSGMGVTVHLETVTAEIAGDGSVTGLMFADGSRLDAGLVVIAAGIRPNVKLALNAGLPVKRGGPNRRRSGVNRGQRGLRDRGVRRTSRDRVRPRGSGMAAGEGPGRASLRSGIGRPLPRVELHHEVEGRWRGSRSHGRKGSGVIRRRGRQVDRSGERRLQATDREKRAAGRGDRDPGRHGSR